MLLLLLNGPDEICHNQSLVHPGQAAELVSYPKGRASYTNFARTAALMITLMGLGMLLKHIMQTNTPKATMKVMMRNANCVQRTALTLRFVVAGIGTASVCP